MAELTDIRDQLALERTRLANERTFLAYIRTALSLIAGSAVLFHFFSTRESYLAVAWVLAALGFVVLLVGAARFIQVRSKLNAGVKRA
jgi:putative membrane protein